LLTSLLNVDERSASSAGRLTPNGTAAGTHWFGDLVDLRSYNEGRKIYRKYLARVENRTPISLSSSLRLVTTPTETFRMPSDWQVYAVRNSDCIPIPSTPMIRDLYSYEGSRSKTSGNGKNLTICIEAGRKVLRTTVYPNRLLKSSHSAFRRATFILRWC
jgi:hypothetical protein